MRVILAAPRGFCAGVNMAIEALERAVQTYGTPLFVYHEIVHNKWVVERLRRRFPRIVGPPRDDICYATQSRQEAVRALAQESGTVLVVGSDRVAGRIPLRRGIYNIRVFQDSHGQPWLRNLILKIQNASTGEEIRLFNLGSEIEQSLGLSVGLEKSTEVSGWKPVELKL